MKISGNPDEFGHKISKFNEALPSKDESAAIAMHQEGITYHTTLPPKIHRACNNTKFDNLHHGSPYINQNKNNGNKKIINLRKNKMTPKKGGKIGCERLKGNGITNTN